MRFQEPHESGEWPPGMAIRVSDGSNLLELLWLRHLALGNAEPSLPAADLPGAPVLSRDVRLVGTWEKLWKDALEHSRQVQSADPRSMSERSDLWSPPDIGSLTNALGIDAADGVRAWRERLTFHGAESDAISSVRVAWEAVLRVVIEVPLVAPYARRLSGETLLVSAATRRSAIDYAQTLSSFAHN